MNDGNTDLQTAERRIIMLETKLQQLRQQVNFLKDPAVSS